MTLHDLYQVLNIILIDIVLSGDNAVVIAMAAHRLPEHQRKRAILWGGGIAIVMRILFTMVMAVLLFIPIVRLAGGILLVWIACKLLLDEEEHAIAPDEADRSAWAAIRMIFLADFVMSLDNMLAVAGASRGSPIKLLLGLFVSIVIIMTCSGYVARLMNRYRWIVLVGAAILAHTAGDMMINDRELAGYIARNHHVSLSSHWETDYMLTKTDVTSFKGAADLPPDLQDVVQYENQTLTFIGPMNEAQRAELLARVADADRDDIEKMFASASKKWPAETWFAVKAHRYPFVAWIFEGLVIAFCLSAPYWWRRSGSNPKEGGAHEAAPSATA